VAVRLLLAGLLTGIVHDRKLIGRFAVQQRGKGDD
jgi:hypothetical protein